MKRIEINGQFADLSEESIGINWQYFDVSSPGVRINPFTSTIKLPFTAKNKRILGYGDAIGGNMDGLRTVANVNFWFGSYKIISNGYLKVTEIDGAYVCSITAKNQLVEALEALSFTTILDGAIVDLSPTYLTAINSLAAGTSGWLLPRTMVGDIASINFYLGGRSELQRHEVWACATLIFSRIATLTGCTFKSAEDGVIIDFDDSDIYTNKISKLYTPAWPYFMASTRVSGVFNYAIRRQASYDGKLYNDKLIEVSTLTLFGGKTPLDFIKIIAQMIGAIIEIKGTEVTFIPLNQIQAFTPVNLSEKLVSFKKSINIPSVEAENEIGYKNTDNLPKTYGKILLEAPVTPVTKKTLLEMGAMLPGLYLPSLYAGAIGSYQIFNTDYSKNSDFANTPLLLYDNGNAVTTNVQWGTFGSPEQSHSAALKILTYLPLSGAYVEYQKWLAAGIYFEADIALNLFDYMRLRPYKLAFIPELGGTFFINKITNFDPYSGKPAKMQLVKADIVVHETIDAPSGLTSTALSSSQINLSWVDNASNETGFKIERSLNGSTWTQIATVTADVTTYSDYGLTATTLYYYRVRAFNVIDNSSYSNTSSVTTLNYIIPVEPTVTVVKLSGEAFNIENLGGTISIGDGELAFSFTNVSNLAASPGVTLYYQVLDEASSLVYEGSLANIYNSAFNIYGDTINISRDAVSGDKFSVVLSTIAV